MSKMEKTTTPEKCKFPKGIDCKGLQGLVPSARRSMLDKHCSKTYERCWEYQKKTFGIDHYEI